MYRAIIFLLRTKISSVEFEPPNHHLDVPHRNLRRAYGEYDKVVTTADLACVRACVRYGQLISSACYNVIS